LHLTPCWWPEKKAKSPNLVDWQKLGGGFGLAHENMGYTLLKKRARPGKGESSRALYQPQYLYYNVLLKIN